MSKANEDKQHYIGHRKRLRQRYNENGIDSLLEHEIVEMLLGYVMPRIDTKPVAHRALQEFGSLRQLLGASRESLTEFGFTDAASAFLRLHNDIEKWMRKHSILQTRLEDYDEAGKILARELEGAATETLVMIMLNSKNEIIGIKTVCEGGFERAGINMRRLLATCLDKNAAKVMIAHNHPSGDIRPSAEDYVTTSSVETFLGAMDVELVEHYVVANGEFFGIKNSRSKALSGMESSYKRQFGCEE